MLKRKLWWIKGPATLAYFFFLYFSLTLGSLKMKLRVTVVIHWRLKLGSGGQCTFRGRRSKGSACLLRQPQLCEQLSPVVKTVLACLNTSCSLVSPSPSFLGVLLICYLGAALRIFIFFCPWYYWSSKLLSQLPRSYWVEFNRIFCSLLCFHKGTCNRQSGSCQNSSLLRAQNCEGREVVGLVYLCLEC